MDAYDHIQSATIRTEASSTSTTPAEEPNGTNLDTASPTTEPGNLTTDLQDAYKSFSASPWGAKLGGFFGSVRKQGESIYQGARDEASIASEEALKGFADLRSTIVSRARGMSLGEAPAAGVASESGEEVKGEEKEEIGTGAGKKTIIKPETSETASSSQDTISPESEGFVARFRAEAEKRLKDIQRAEDAADEALLKFGTNIRNFLRDAVIVSGPPEDEVANDEAGAGGRVLFESKDAEGKRVIHTTRFDAQLHVIHCSLDSFLKDPASSEYGKWKEEFDVEKKTDAISADLKKYEELRRAMEKLVPEKVEYDAFWCRYYFLRMVIESEEKRRREMLKGKLFRLLWKLLSLYLLYRYSQMSPGATLNSEKEVSWDEDSDSEPSTPQPKPTTTTSANAKAGEQESQPLSSSVATLEPLEPRKSQDQHSQSGSDASYDLVSGATSRTPSSPKEENGAKKAAASETVKEESDEDDWE